MGWGRGRGLEWGGGGMEDGTGVVWVSHSGVLILVPSVLNQCAITMAPLLSTLTQVNQKLTLSGIVSLPLGASPSLVAPQPAPCPSSWSGLMRSASAVHLLVRVGGGGEEGEGGREEGRRGRVGGGGEEGRRGRVGGGGEEGRRGRVGGGGEEGEGGGRRGGGEEREGGGGGGGWGGRGEIGGGRVIDKVVERGLS